MLGPEVVCFKTYGLGLKKGQLSPGGGEQDQVPEGNWPKYSGPCGLSGVSHATISIVDLCEEPGIDCFFSLLPRETPRGKI